MRAALTAQYARLRTDRYAVVASKGLLLTHLIGFAFFFSIIFNRGIPLDHQYMKIADLPIRLIALWLIVDRFGRYSRIKTSVWDYVHLFFISAYGLGYVWAEVAMTRDTGLFGYFAWISIAFNPYLYFLVVREAIVRRGFNPEVLLRWMLGTLAFACVIALLQSLDPGGARSVIDGFYNQRAADARMIGPSAPWQARGAFNHANAMSIMLVVSFPLLVGLANYRKLKPVDIAIGLLMIVTLFATYSRIGVVSFIGLCFAFLGILFIQRKYHKAMLATFTVASMLAIFAMAVVVFDINRYKVLVTGEGPVRNMHEIGIQGWYLRQETINKAMTLAQKYPVTGVAVATSAINQEMVVYESAYSFEGLLLNVYAYAFVSYGIIGLIFIGGILWTTLGEVRHVRTKRAFAAAAVLAGVGLAITGLAENTIFMREQMIVANVIVALSVMNVLRRDDDPTPSMPAAH
jgi:hypothetical protein